MIQLLADEGFEGMAEAIAILVNEAMKIGLSSKRNNLRIVNHWI